MTSRVPAAASLAVLLSIAQPVHAGGYVAPVVEIIPPVDMPAPPTAPNWWLIGGVAALGVLCLIVCGGDDDDARGGSDDDDDDDNPVIPPVTPVPVPAAFIGAATGIAALGGAAIRRRRKTRA
ncbi:hypothetical protein MLD63_13010 [Paracoccus sp. TK19116]|uniref:Uncharacterized protein n=1 Tax=Paracoccus albicereus TaxID=2922394 RepID=A0ABT1MSS0_9RHOB|nr:hypothetical protein [Paracoccus albicereus]MCQ0971342.1 hypothetical protein [Paracoccus albicereus]